MEVSFIMPCLNEAETLSSCIRAACKFLAENSFSGEIIIVDNGSTDGSIEIAKIHDVVLINESNRGYGSAYCAGLKVAKGKIIVLSDADGTYKLEEAGALISTIQSGYDLVVGSRINGRILPGAMPWLHQFLGVPVLTWLLCKMHGLEITDAHCGMRAIKRDALSNLNLKSSGMEFASEMLIAAARNELSIAEVPITYYPRLGRSKLRAVRDGVRHLKIILDC